MAVLPVLPVEHADMRPGPAPVGVVPGMPSARAPLAHGQGVMTEGHDRVTKPVAGRVSLPSRSGFQNRPSPRA